MFRQSDDLAADVLNQTATIIKEAQVIEGDNIKTSLPETKQQTSE